jgi:hypothetical protein
MTMYGKRLKMSAQQSDYEMTGYKTDCVECITQRLENDEKRYYYTSEVEMLLQFEFLNNDVINKK